MELKKHKHSANSSSPSLATLGLSTGPQQLATPLFLQTHNLADLHMDILDMDIVVMDIVVMDMEMDPQALSENLLLLL